MAELREGAARIVRADAHNFAVERYVKIVPKTKEGEPEKPARFEWQEAGYYGHRLDFAANSALFQSMPIGEAVTPKMVADATAEIVRLTKDALGATDDCA
jgi:hypothetical protein